MPASRRKRKKDSVLPEEILVASNIDGDDVEIPILVGGSNISFRVFEHLVVIDKRTMYLKLRDTERRRRVATHRS